jgi:hypothetical protein
MREGLAQFVAPTGLIAAVVSDVALLLLLLLRSGRYASLPVAATPSTPIINSGFIALVAERARSPARELRQHRQCRDRVPGQERVRVEPMSLYAYR